MSMRVIDCSSSKRNSASALASSVFPTPAVRGTGAPVGLPGLRRPTRAATDRLRLTEPHRLHLADDARAEPLLHLEELLALGLEHPRRRDAGPVAEHLRDGLFGDRRPRDVAASRRCLLLRRPGRSRRRFHVRDPARAQLAELGEVLLLARLRPARAWSLRISSLSAACARAHRATRASARISAPTGRQLESCAISCLARRVPPSRPLIASSPSPEPGELRLVSRRRRPPDASSMSTGRPSISTIPARTRLVEQVDGAVRERTGPARSAWRESHRGDHADRPIRTWWWAS